jgi:hypothetical protein
MVEHEVTDGKRIAQLLASELTGLELGPLAGVRVVDADPAAAPTESGTDAYRLVYGGRTVAVVSMFPDHATVSLHVEPAPSTADNAGDGLNVSGTEIRIETGAAVKRAVDVLRTLLREGEGGGGPDARSSAGWDSPGSGGDDAGRRP